MNTRPIYSGPLDRKKMPQAERFAYEAFCALKARSKKQGLPAPTFSAREFIAWWLQELQTFNGVRATCGRLDHSKGYSWDNISLQDMAENSREMNLRTNAVAREIAKGKKVFALDKVSGAKVIEFPSIRTAARLLGISQRQVQFLIRGKHKECSLIAYDLREAA